MTTTPDTVTTSDKPHLTLAGLAQQAGYAYRFAKAGQVTEAVEHLDAIERLSTAYRADVQATTPDTTTRIDEIRAREQAATAGPWGVYESGSMIDVAADLKDTGCGYRARRGIARFEDEPLDNDPTHREWTAEEDWAQVQADAAFVASARNDVPFLLDRVAELEAVLTELWKRVDDAGSLMATSYVEDALRPRPGGDA